MSLPSQGQTGQRFIEPTTTKNGVSIQYTKDESSCEALARKLNAYSYGVVKVADGMYRCTITKFTF